MKMDDCLYKMGIIMGRLGSIHLCCIAVSVSWKCMDAEPRPEARVDTARALNHFILLIDRVQIIYSSRLFKLAFFEISVVLNQAAKMMFSPKTTLYDEAVCILLLRAPFHFRYELHLRSTTTP